MSRKNDREAKAARRAERDARHAANRARDDARWRSQQVSDMEQLLERLRELVSPYQLPGVPLRHGLTRMSEARDPATAEAVKLIERAAAAGWVDPGQASPAEGPALRTMRAQTAAARRVAAAANATAEALKRGAR